MSYLGPSAGAGVGNKAATTIACTAAVGEAAGSTEELSVNPGLAEVAAGTLAVVVEERTFVVRITVAAIIGRPAEADTQELTAATFVAELRPGLAPALGSELPH